MLPFGLLWRRAARTLALATGFFALAVIQSCARSSVSLPALQQPGQKFKDYADSATSKKTKNKGWGDEQRLAIMDSSGPYPLKLRYGPLVRIIPHDDLEKLEMKDFQITGWQFVARFEVTPLPQLPELGYPKLSLNPGDQNFLFLRRSDVGVWEALIGPGCDSPTTTLRCTGSRYRVRELERHVEGATDTKLPPGTARFVWSDADETVWIRCVSGCCQLDQKITEG